MIFWLSKPHFTIRESIIEGLTDFLGFREVSFRKTFESRRERFIVKR